MTSLMKRLFPPKMGSAKAKLLLVEAASAVRLGDALLAQVLDVTQPGDWQFNHQTGALRWQFDNGTAHELPGEAVGTWARSNQTFLWAWAHRDLAQGPIEAARGVRSYCHKNDIAEGLAPQQVCDLETATRLAGLALTLGDLTALHIGEPQPGLVTFTGLRLAPDTTKIGARA